MKKICVCGMRYKPYSITCSYSLIPTSTAWSLPSLNFHQHAIMTQSIRYASLKCVVMLPGRHRQRQHELSWVVHHWPDRLLYFSVGKPGMESRRVAFLSKSTN